MHPKQILEKAWSLIQQPGKWAKGAVTCARLTSMGALWRVSSEPEELEELEELEDLEALELLELFKLF